MPPRFGSRASAAGKKVGVVGWWASHPAEEVTGFFVRFEGATTEPGTLNALGLFQTCLGRREEAVKLFERSLALKPDQPTVVESLRVVRRGVR